MYVQGLYEVHDHLTGTHLTASMEHLCARHCDKAEETADPVLEEYIL